MERSNSANIDNVERWISAAAGLCLAGRALRSRSASKIGLLLGAELLRRGATGHCYLYSALGLTEGRTGQRISVKQGVHARAAVTIGKPRERVFQFFKQFENMRLIEHVVSVDASQYPYLHWKAEGLGGIELEWDAEIHNEIENELIAWRSLPGADIASAGSLHFKDAPGSRGTEVSAHFQYEPPAGRVVDAVMKLLGRDPESELEQGMMRMKQILETGEMASTEGQPVGDQRAQRRNEERRPASSEGSAPEQELATA